jgi:LysM repeat protein
LNMRSIEDRFETQVRPGTPGRVPGGPVHTIGTSPTTISHQEDVMSAIVIGTGIPARTRSSRAVSSSSSAVRAASPARPAARLRITRRGRAVLAVLIATPLAFGAVVAGLGQAAAADQAGPHSTTAVDYTYVTVQPGDTLWSIAGDVAPGVDRRVVVDRIVDLNQLGSGDLRAGERIAVPTGLDR